VFLCATVSCDVMYIVDVWVKAIWEVVLGSHRSDEDAVVRTRQARPVQ